VMVGSKVHGVSHHDLSRHSLEEVKKTCVQCHDAAYGKMTDEWQQEISDRIKRLKLSLEVIQRRECRTLGQRGRRSSPWSRR